MSNFTAVSSEELLNPKIEKCSTCKELVNIKDVDPNYEGQLATYSEDTYCTLKCMQSAVKSED